MIQRISGIFVFALGLALVSWVAYNQLIELQPAARGASPIPPLLLSALFMWVGSTWARGRGVRSR